MSSIKYRFLFIAILIFSVLSLSIAYFIEHILGHQPCNLCLVERIPYFVAAIFASLLFILKKYEKIILIIIGFVFIFSTVISFYHFGIEQGFINESLICSLGNDNGATSTEELLKQLEKITISCKNVTFTFLGLSLATFNTIISLVISVIMFKTAINYDKNK
jgi:disulfide bond formation protein DsbB